MSFYFQVAGLTLSFQVWCVWKLAAIKKVSDENYFVGLVDFVILARRRDVGNTDLRSQIGNPDHRLAIAGLRSATQITDLRSSIQISDQRTQKLEERE